eukprot:TRINITY_DN1231_c0_g1_i5.p1 TRINITY_DN1231_c0_g1~~TRINITY_DN1231_c0_g1_i5.p1  ORF type:complete len:441 (+),score=75.57 TRINITY_DN1231_c0_g1_i5:53-1375(+)
MATCTEANLVPVLLGRTEKGSSHRRLPQSVQENANLEECPNSPTADDSTVQALATPRSSMPTRFMTEESLPDRGGGYIWRKFLPAMFIYPMWLYIMVKQDAWSESFGTYYPLSLAMIPGSMIAGSTPLGGGVVAFPVTVLLIKLQPAQGRDFSLMIQSIGMAAASFLIMISKPHLCHVWLIVWSLLSAIGGMIFGFSIAIDGFVINIIYTTSIACFALAYMYRNMFMSRSSQEADCRRMVPSEAGALLTGGFDLQSNPIAAFFGKRLPAALTAGVCICGFYGGFLSAKLGSGADMLAYMFGVFVWNTSVPRGAELPDNMLTASSVLIMAGCSIAGAVLRSLSVGMSREVMLCWGACVPVVVIGAPVGSLVLTPKRTLFLRRCFYVLALIQFGTFDILEIKGNLLAWMCTLGAVLVQALYLVCHYVFVVHPRRHQAAEVQV